MSEEHGSRSQLIPKTRCSGRAEAFKSTRGGMTEAHATRGVRCPRSDRGFGLGSLSLAVVPVIAGVSDARLRFKAAIQIDHRWRCDNLSGFDRAVLQLGLDQKYKRYP